MKTFSSYFTVGSSVGSKEDVTFKFQVVAYVKFSLISTYQQIK